MTREADAESEIIIDNEYPFREKIWVHMLLAV